MENERKNKVEVSLDPEVLILWIEKAKKNAYESINHTDITLEAVFGMQFAYDDVINHIRELQGCVDK